MKHGREPTCRDPIERVRRMMVSEIHVSGGKYLKFLVVTLTSLFTTNFGVLLSRASLISPLIPSFIVRIDLSDNSTYLQMSYD